MKILVTGVAGFIGSNFARYVLNNTDWSIFGIDAEKYSANLNSIADLHGPRFRYAKVDICDFDDLKKACEGQDLVVNFAAETHNDNSIANPRPFLKSNVEGLFNLLEVCRLQGFRLHHVSTDEVFGDLPYESEELFTEDSPYRPSSPYSATKAAGDHLVRAWIRTFGISATISNCSNNYGPYQHIEKFIPRQIVQLILGKNIELYGQGKNVRDWLHVDDHSAAILRILTDGSPGKTYLIGANQRKSNLEIAEMLIEILGLEKDRIIFVTDRRGHDERYAVNASRLSTGLGWTPNHTDVKSDLTELINWYTHNQDWWLGLKVDTQEAEGE